MQLAADSIEITIGDKPVVLLPSLRAALLIARRHDGFAAPLRGILDGNLTMIAGIIHAGADRTADIFKEVATIGLAATLAQVTEPLVRFVLAMAGHNDTKSAAPVSDPIPFTVYFEGLYRAATGVLGWPPANAWAATPAEIQAAYEGRVGLLRSIFGSADTETVEHARDPNAQFDREAFNALKSQLAG